MSVELPSSLPEEECRYVYVYVCDPYCNAHTFIYAHCVYTVYVHMCYSWLLWVAKYSSSVVQSIYRCSSLALFAVFDTVESQ